MFPELDPHISMRIRTYPEGVKICLSRVVDISEDAEALFRMKVDLVVYLSVCMLVDGLSHHLTVLHRTTSLIMPRAQILRP